MFVKSLGSQPPASLWEVSLLFIVEKLLQNFV